MYQRKTHLKNIIILLESSLYNNIYTFTCVHNLEKFNNVTYFIFYEIEHCVIKYIQDIHFNKASNDISDNTSFTRKHKII